MRFCLHLQFGDQGYYLWFSSTGAVMMAAVGGTVVKIVKRVLTAAMRTSPIRKDMSAFPSLKTLACDTCSVRSSQTHFHVSFTKCL